MHRGPIGLCDHDRFRPIRRRQQRSVLARGGDPLRRLQLRLSDLQQLLRVPALRCCALQLSTTLRHSLFQLTSLVRVLAEAVFAQMPQICQWNGFASNRRYLGELWVYSMWYISVRLNAVISMTAINISFGQTLEKWWYRSISHVSMKSPDVFPNGVQQWNGAICIAGVHQP